MRSPIQFPIQSMRSCSELENNCCDVRAALISPSNYHAPKLCTVSDLEKTKGLYDSFMRLLDNRAFSHAASIAALNFNETKPDIRMAAIWSGIEALVGVEHELSYRIPLLCSCVLETEKANRLVRFNDIQKLYQARSRCVHGSGMKPKKLEAAIEGSQSLLCELIEWTCGNGEVLSPQQAKELPIVA